MNTPTTHNPDMDIALHYALGEDGLIWLYHDKPFSKALSWIEYDLENSRIDFILEDGDFRNFGIPIDRAYARHLQNMHSIPVILREGQNVLDGEYYPLIIHSA